MISGKHLIAQLYQLSTAVLAAHSDMGILQTQSKGICKPPIGVLTAHNSGLPDPVELPVCLDAEVPKISVCRYAHWLITARVRCHIGVACGVVVADIKFPIVLTVVVDL